ncbi:hypothetical protein ACHQM5_030857 [Ranunculus cassubicifolius]
MSMAGKSSSRKTFFKPTPRFLNSSTSSNPQPSTKQLNSSTTLKKTRTSRSLSNTLLKKILKKKFWKKNMRSPVPRIPKTEKQPVSLYEKGMSLEPKVLSVTDLGGNEWSIFEFHLPHNSPPPTTDDKDEVHASPMTLGENSELLSGGSTGDIKWEFDYSDATITEFLGDGPIFWDA